MNILFRITKENPKKNPMFNIYLDFDYGFEWKN